MRAALRPQQRVDTGERERECVCAEGHVVDRVSELCCMALGPALPASLSPKRAGQGAGCGRGTCPCQGPEQRYLDPQTRAGKPSFTSSLAPCWTSRVTTSWRQVVSFLLSSPLHISPAPLPLPASPAGRSHPSAPSPAPHPFPLCPSRGLPSHGPKSRGVSGSLEGQPASPHRQEAGPARRASAAPSTKAFQM